MFYEYKSIAKISNIFEFKEIRIQAKKISIGDNCKSYNKKIKFIEIEF